jgi:PKD domain-containing protein
VKVRPVLVFWLVAFICAMAFGHSSSRAIAATPPSTVGVHADVDVDGGFGVNGDNGGGSVDGTGHQGGTPAGGTGLPATNNCKGCTYKWVSVCDPALNIQCGNACPAGFLMESLVITNPALPASTIGATECRSPSGATPAQVEQAASDQFSQLLTTAHPTQQPANGGIVNLPTLFATNTPQQQTFNETLLGVQVTLNVDATWTWDFGDGATLTTTDAGGAYPITSLSHTYLAAGQNTVTLTTNWTGTFSMAGGPAIVIPGGAIPRVSAPLVLDIHEAHGVLVTN